MKMTMFNTHTTVTATVDARRATAGRGDRKHADRGYAYKYRVI